MEINRYRNSEKNIFGYQEPTPELKQVVDCNIYYKTIFSNDYIKILHCKQISTCSISNAFFGIKILAGYKFYLQNTASYDIEYYSEVYVSNFSFNDDSDPKLKRKLNLVGEKISHISWGHDDSYIIYCIHRNDNAYIVFHFLNDERTIIMDSHPLAMFDNHPYTRSSTTGRICFKRKISTSIPTTIIEPIEASHVDGSKIPQRTLTGLLRSSGDRQLFMNLVTVDLCLCYMDSLISIDILVPNVPIKDYVFSYSGKYLLYTEYTTLSTIVNHSYFGSIIYLIDLQNITFRKKLYDLEVNENVKPIADSCIMGPRNFEFTIINNKDHLFWFEALDEGNPKTVSEYRDKIMLWNIEYGDPMEICRTEMRAFDVLVDTNDNLWIIQGSNKKKRINISRIKETLKTIFEYDDDDLYNNPGYPVMLFDNYGCPKIIYPLEKNDETILIKKNGHTQTGINPSVELYNIDSKEYRQIWKSIKDKIIEIPRRFFQIYPGYLSILYTRETLYKSATYHIDHIKIPNLIVSYKRDYLYQPKEEFYLIKQGKLIIDNSTIYSSIYGYQKEIIKYERSDGISLSASVYLPPDYKLNEKRKILIWAYPHEYNHKKDVGQFRSSPHQFSRISWNSPLLWLSKGYIVVNDCDMPILSVNDDHNDTFLKQLEMNAAAIVNYLKTRKMTDGNNIAIGGHSYGAFMVANLLAHTDYFAVGIARSGAYNRTLTPFGFQNEERDLWTAKNIYLEMSPLLHADKIKAPILLIHGQNDNNPGTSVIQSERFYEALRGLGKIAKLVVLPYEGHSYEYYESLNHMLAVTESWLDKWLS